MCPKRPCHRFEEPLLTLVRKALLGAYADESPSSLSGWSSTLADLPRSSSAPLEAALMGCIRWAAWPWCRAPRLPLVPVTLCVCLGT
jgi:hypothetical protein